MSKPYSVLAFQKTGATRLRLAHVGRGALLHHRCGPVRARAAQALGEAGSRSNAYERHSDVGGIWDDTNPNTPIYESAHFISSKSQSAFDGFPMPAEYPDYPAGSRFAIISAPSRTVRSAQAHPVQYRGRARAAGRNPVGGELSGGEVCATTV